MIFLFWCNY